MTQHEYNKIESHMKIHMTDSAHDINHIYRVLYAALDIARSETGVDLDILTAACLLHDIARGRQFANPSICHAQEGGVMANDFLLSIGWDETRAQLVCDCISSHRFRGDNPPQSIEAKILFDADKIDVCGALGIARTLIYEGHTKEPLYVLDDDGNITTTECDKDISSFFQEWEYKLKKVYDGMYTQRAKDIAAKRKKTAQGFRDALYEEICELHASIPSSRP